jgi:hypothetical protein
MVQDLFDRLNSQLILTLGKNLNEEQLTAYSKLSAEDVEKGNKYLVQELPNAQQLFFESMQEFRQVFLSNTK